MTAKKEAIKGQQADESEEEVNTIPGEGSDVPPENVKPGKSELPAAPSIAAEKSAAPRKHQGS